jgi:hypothetical protein
MRSALFTLLIAAALPAADLYVSPKGNDSAPGTSARPLATLEKARDKARELARGGAPVNVWLRAGDYPIRKTLELGEADSGTETAPIVYRAEQGARVRLLGGTVLKKFSPVKDRAVLDRLDPEARRHVLECDLRALGISDFGRLSSRGFGRKRSAAHMELFFRDHRMTLAQWPNKGFVKIAGFPGTGNDDEHGGSVGKLEEGFFYEGDRPARWKKLNDIWVHGYWSWDWANSYEQIDSIDQAKHLIRTRPPYGNYSFRKGQRFYFLNVLEELDEAGEYFVDRESAKLYFWPPAPIASGEAAVSIFDGAAIKTQNTSHVAFGGFTIEYLRGNAIEVSGGTAVRVFDTVIRNLGNTAVTVEAGARHSVSGSHIYQVGDAGIYLTGGDRSTLSPAGHEARGNDIHDMGEWSRTYQPAIMISGVGNRILHNHIHDGPHSGIQLSGNEHLIEFNEIDHLAKETGDVGAFYMGRDYTMRGNVIRYNFFHHTGGMGMGAMGVYMDDCSGGATISGNVFYKMSRATFIGGGRDNRIENNVYVECDPAVQIDARGLDPRPVWHNMVYKFMKERLLEMRPHEPPYSNRYPELAQLDKYYEGSSGIPPEGNRVVHNICVGKWLDIRWRADPKLIEVRDNLTDQDPLFVDAAKMNFQLKDESPAFKLGFERIPFEKIGPERRSSAAR